jgi:hypothetical protein
MSMAGTATKPPTSARSGGIAGITEIHKPVNMPPGLDVQNGSGDAVADAQPAALTDAQLIAMVNGAGAATSPALEPPGVEAVRGVTASTWVQNIQVSALWSINQNRNSWAAFAGQGWQKFANNSDSAIMAFTTLAAHARVALGPTSYRAESDNMVHEIYVW